MVKQKFKPIFFMALKLQFFCECSKLMLRDIYFAISSLCFARVQKYDIVIGLRTKILFQIDIFNNEVSGSANNTVENF